MVLISPQSDIRAQSYDFSKINQKTRKSVQVHRSTAPDKPVDRWCTGRPVNSTGRPEDVARTQKLCNTVPVDRHSVPVDRWDPETPEMSKNTLQTFPNSNLTMGMDQGRWKVIFRSYTH